ncbi:MAG: beta-propeller domain-containing protein [Proteobacteria bacterium]|nr:beta-propeller domain-containing protein [Pseudomonadota bacterium]
MRAAKILIAALALGLAAGPAFAAKPHATLKHFTSEAELRRYLKRVEKYMIPPPPPAPPMMEAAPTAMPAPAAASGSDAITNVQTAGVDEGDIVKKRGDVLVILRRGRLFTVSIAGGSMKPVDSIEAYPPGANAYGDWYDEMVIAENRVLVIGYSYARGGTQIDRFIIDDAGRLKFEDAYQLRSNDYYSSRNYATRLIGKRLVYYSPNYLPYGNPSIGLPALRRWSGDPKAGFKRIGSARDVFMPPQLEEGMIGALHTVTSCDVTTPVLDCRATSVFGPEGHEFYVSSDAVYVWLTPYSRSDEDKRARSLLYRLPLDGSAPSAVAVRGGPTDQFSFRDDGDVLNVLVRSDSAGDAMWTSEFGSGAVALLRLPISEFGNGRREAALSDYRNLPVPKDYFSMQNRFVGDFVLYGNGNGWSGPQDGGATLIAVRLSGGSPAKLRLPHAIDRIEVMGRNAVVIGSDSKSVYFSAVLLDRVAHLGDRYVLGDASQAETRSHGFFFKAYGDGDTGILGLPIARAAQPGYQQLFYNSAAMLFLRRTEGAFKPLGTLDSHPESAVNDNCVASCVDWYGNARPIFAGNRTFALMGYELVEGAIARDGVHETGRVDFAPHLKDAER